MKVGYYDYVSPGLVDPGLARLFPHMVEADRARNTWRYLRRDIPHIWRADERSPVMGFVSLDEATLLHNLALPFAGKRALEIGCWRGWSTAHIASAGVTLDIIDPVLAEDGVRSEIAGMLAALGAGDRTRLYPAASPAGLFDAAAAQKEPWSFAFVDGDHEAQASAIDAANLAPMMAEDAMVVFHDLASPDVTEGLDTLRDRGWSTMIFQTMQIMGVAWRGNVAPPTHRPDPDIDWNIPGHLTGYAISGESPGERAARFGKALLIRSSVERDLAATRMALHAIIDRREREAEEAAAWVAALRDVNDNWAKTADELRSNNENLDRNWWDVVEKIQDNWRQSQQKTVHDWQKVTEDFREGLNTLYQRFGALAAQRDAIAAERDGIAAERDGIAAERDQHWTSAIDQLKQDQASAAETNNRNWQKVVADFKTALDKQAQYSAALEAQRDSLSTDLSTARAKQETAQSALDAANAAIAETEHRRWRNRIRRAFGRST